jgi:hypothetical protein
VAETICESMAHAAEDLDISAIAVFTETGTTARQLSKYRPKSPIFGLSSVERVIHRMTLLWGVHPILCNKLATAEQMVETAERLLEAGGHVLPRQILGIVAGTRTKSGSTNFLRLHVLGDSLSESSASRDEKVAHPEASGSPKPNGRPRHCPGGCAQDVDLVPGRGRAQDISGTFRHPFDFVFSSESGTGQARWSRV